MALDWVTPWDVESINGLNCYCYCSLCYCYERYDDVVVAAVAVGLRAF